MSECVMCEEIVTNPLCLDCVNKGIEQWLSENDLPSFELGLFGTEQQGCIRCNKSIDVCLYCHTKQVYEWLKTQKTDKNKLAEFIEFFHFDLDKKGYVAKEGYN